MSETGGARQDIDQLRFADLAAGGDVTEPTSGRKDSGYLFKDPHPHDEFNFHRLKSYENIDHLRLQTPREFDILAEVFRASSPAAILGDAVRVRQGSVTPLPFTPLFDVAGAVNPATQIGSDSARLYYHASGSNVLHAAWLDDGSAAWSNSADANNIVSVYSDGLNAYATRVNNSVTLHDVTDGSIRATITGLASTAAHVVANGSEMAIETNTGGGGADVTIYTGINTGSPSVLASTTDASSGILSMAIDATSVYFGDDGGVLRSADLQTGVQNWALTIRTIAANDIQALATDGLLVYAGLENTGAARPDVWALRTDIPTVQWTLTLDEDILWLTVDDRHLWIMTASNLYQVDKYSGRILGSDSGLGNLLMGESDGFVVPLATSTNIRAMYCGGPGRIWNLADPEDRGRRYFNLAVPAREPERAPADKNFFGDTWEEFEDLTDRTTTSATFVQYTRWTTPIVPVGTYRLDINYIWQQQTNNNDFQVRVQINDSTTPLQHREQVAPVGGADRRVTTAWVIVGLTEDSHDIDLDYAAPTGGTAEIFQARLSLTRVS